MTTISCARITSLSRDSFFDLRRDWAIQDVLHSHSTERPVQVARLTTVEPLGLTAHASRGTSRFSCCKADVTRLDALKPAVSLVRPSES